MIEKHKLFVSNLSSPLLKVARGGKFGYQLTSYYAVEPTVLSHFGLRNSTEFSLEIKEGEAGEKISLCSKWLNSFQTENGALAPLQGLGKPYWGTPFGILWWAFRGDSPLQLKKGVDFSLLETGRFWVNKSPEIIGHDTNIPGWNWFPGTHSWVEPTVFYLLALRSAGVSIEHPRIRQGLDLIHNRFIPGEGWNYGNTLVNKTLLRGHPGPTALALMVLKLYDQWDENKFSPLVEQLKTQSQEQKSPTLAGMCSLALILVGHQVEEVRNLLLRFQDNPYLNGDYPLHSAWVLLPFSDKFIHFLQNPKGNSNGK